MNKQTKKCSRVEWLFMLFILHHICSLDSQRSTLSQMAGIIELSNWRFYTPYIVLEIVVSNKAHTSHIIKSQTPISIAIHQKKKRKNLFRKNTKHALHTNWPIQPDCVVKL